MGLSLFRARFHDDLASTVAFFFGRGFSFPIVLLKIHAQSDARICAPQKTSSSFEAIGHFFFQALGLLSAFFPSVPQSARGTPQLKSGPFSFDGCRIDGQPTNLAGGRSCNS